MHYTEKEKEILNLNYPLYGPLYCSKLLNRDQNAIYAQAKRMGLKKIGHDKHPSMQKINPEQFWNISSPEVAYFLGYFWADGNIIYKKNKTCNMYKIAFEITSQDASDIMPVMKSLGNWSILTRKRKSNWKETTIFSTNSKDLYNFLFKHDYKTKSFSEPTKILSKIPENLKPYWWRGFFDGDGSLSFSKTEKNKILGFYGTHQYKWLELKKFTKELKISNICIYDGVSKLGHKKSVVHIYRSFDIKILCDYFLALKPELALKRKTIKMKEFLKRFHFNDSPQSPSLPSHPNPETHIKSKTYPRQEP